MKPVPVQILSKQRELVTLRNEWGYEEEYVRDERIELRPSEVVQSKLLKVLPKGVPIPVSCVHNAREVRR